MIVAERNFGGAMVAETLRHVDPNIPIREVVASRGKMVRAEPVAFGSSPCFATYACGQRPSSLSQSG